MSETRSRQQVFRDMMQELDAFREEYVNRHQIQGLEREDPDVKRLTEAMGFFAARIQHAGQSYLEGMRRSLLKEFFPYPPVACALHGDVTSRTYCKTIGGHGITSRHRTDWTRSRA